MNTTGSARRLRDAVRHLVVAHGALEETRRPCGAELSIPHAYALLELRSADEPMTVSALASRLAIDRTNVSRLCARMERDGELVRRTDPEDGRARRLELTARGRRLARGVDETSARHFALLVEQLGGASHRIVETLHTLADAMRALENEEE